MREQMTIHKALCELKTLDSRIESAISGSEFAVSNKHSNDKIHGVPVADFVKSVKEQYQSVRTLINRRNAIKRAVTRSNATTMVSIGGHEYTVAEAIDMKAKGTSYLTSLASRIERDYAQAKGKADMFNGDALDSRCDEYVKSLYGASDLKNMSEEIRKVREAFITSQTVEIIDPINAAAEAKKLRDEIDAFMSDVDAALSVSNALTTIDVEYDTL